MIQVLRWASILLVAFLQGCNPSSDPADVKRLPITGDIKIDHLRTKGSVYIFRLSNQATYEIGFRGDFEKLEGAFPWDHLTRCRLSESDRWSEAPFGLVDGQAAGVRVPSGAEVMLNVDLAHEREFLKRFEGGRCRLEFRLQPGGSAESNDFEP